MSSSTSDHEGVESNPTSSSRKRLLPIRKRDANRACDTCRRRKVRCDGPSKRKATCSNCAANHVPCTYAAKSERRTPSQQYMERLERYIDQILLVFKKFCPEVDINKEIGPRPCFGIPRPSSGGGDESNAALYPDTQEHLSHAHAIQTSLLMSLPSDEDSDDTDIDPTHEDILDLTSWFSFMQLNPSLVRPWGKSSPYPLWKSTLELKSEYLGVQPPHPALIQDIMLRRPHIWRTNKQEAQDLKACYDRLDGRTFEFPDDALMAELIDQYFLEANAYRPLLHRPSFCAAVSQRLHLRDRGFASVLLCVCALGARFVNDPRVFPEDRSEDQTAGWKWFRQVTAINQSPWAMPSLYDLQLCSLIAQYIIPTHSSQAWWMIIGTGLRLVQDIGAHRRRVYKTTPSVQEELVKRAVWTLIDLDRSLSSFFGRTSTLQDEEYDLDMPVECDDEYWDGAFPFQQPAEQPSSVAFFTHHLKLQKILNMTLRTLYTTGGSKTAEALGLEDRRRPEDVVAQIDLAMCQWLASLPEHLQWDPNRKVDLFFNQSAVLHVAYYSLKITVHRIFLSSDRKDLSDTLPSLAVCTHAARASINIVDTQRRRVGKPLPQQMHNVFVAGLILLRSLYSGGRDDVYLDAAAQVNDVHKCINILKVIAPRWQNAAKHIDLLTEVARIDNPPINRGLGLEGSHPSDQPRFAEPLGGGTACDLSLPLNAQTASPEGSVPIDGHVSATPLPHLDTAEYSHLDYSLLGDYSYRGALAELFTPHQPLQGPYTAFLDGNLPVAHQGITAAEYNVVHAPEPSTVTNLSIDLAQSYTATLDRTLTTVDWGQQHNQWTSILNAMAEYPE